MACVVSYSLYPEALVPQIVHEVSTAFDWAMEHVEQYGGDRRRVTACWMLADSATSCTWLGSMLVLSVAASMLSECSRYHCC